MDVTLDTPDVGPAEERILQKAIITACNKPADCSLTRLKNWTWSNDHEGGGDVLTDPSSSHSFG